jgi:hypothetical protein
MRSDGLFGGLILLIIGLVGLLIYFPNYQQFTDIGHLGRMVNPQMQQTYNQLIEYVIGMTASLLAGLFLLVYGVASNPSISPKKLEAVRQNTSANLLHKQKSIEWKFISKDESAEVIYRSMLSSSIGLLLILVGFMGGVIQFLGMVMNQVIFSIFVIGLALSVYGIFNLYKF